MVVKKQTLASLKAEHRATKARSRAAWAAYDPYAKNPVVGAMRASAELTSNMMNAAVRVNPFAQLAVNATKNAMSLPLLFSPLGYRGFRGPLGC